MSNNPASFEESLGQLGLRFVRGRLIAFVAAFVAGMIVAYVLPQFYGQVVGRGLDQVSSCDISCRDTFNKYAMTVLTLAVSFVVALVVSRKLRR